MSGAVSTDVSPTSPTPDLLVDSITGFTHSTSPALHVSVRNAGDAEAPASKLLLHSRSNANNTNQNTGGGSQLRLRDLDTLVLINGRRVAVDAIAGVGGKIFVDVNQIPPSAIERVEVLADGASAIYGSDAIAGVVNVILRKRYNGTEIGGYAGISQKGDGQTYDVHAISGTAGDRSSILFSLGYQEQRPVYAADRNFSLTTYNWDWDQNCYATGNYIFGIAGDCTNKANAPAGNSSTFPNGRFSIPGSACADATLVGGHPALAAVCAASSNKGGGSKSQKRAAGREGGRKSS